MIIAMVGLILFAFIISWVFGREFADRTLKDMLAVPVPRSSILLAKFIVVAAWSAALSAIIFTAGLIMGALMRLPGGSLSVLQQGSALVLVTACLVIAGIMPFALLAGVGRGYLLPLAGAVVALMAANLVVLAGWGEYFPWSIPGIYAMGDYPLEPISYWIVFFTGLMGILATYFWWKYADQNR
jgi:ABC-2 type transport system permease protein